MVQRKSATKRQAPKWRIWLGVFLAGTAVLSLTALLRTFYIENTVLVPTTGGIYIEGSVGELQPLNPLFTVTNDVNRDIVSLIFAGLQRYNPNTKKIEDDLAELTVDDEGKIYTLQLKPDLYWHDHTAQNPHPVTIEDVLFTFESIKDPEFPNIILQQNFQGVSIEAMDDRTVRFVLEEPYHFFPSNLTLGIVPRRAFAGVQPRDFDKVLDFAFKPVGAGPYAFKGLVPTELSTEVTLEKVERSIKPEYHLERIVFRIFPDYQTLLSDLRNLHGVRLVPRNDKGEPLIPRRFQAQNYTLPQYVALFTNLHNPILQDVNLRLALQLGTNKQELVDTINESIIVDTPLLEIDVSDWRYKHDRTAAQGALFNSDWHLPEKLRLQSLLEIRDSNKTGVLKIDPIVYLDTGAVLTVTGSLASAGSTGATLNGLPIEVHPTQSGAWIAALPTVGSGSLNIGSNAIRLYSEDGDILDSAYVWRTDQWNTYKQASVEQDLLELFVESRAGSIPPEDRIMVSELYTQDGFLRKRRTTDPLDIRVNEKGEKLTLRLLTSSRPAQYKEIAELLAAQYAELGIHVGIEVPETREEFEEKLLKRDYDLLLFGQSLLDNLDSYPYWHSSGVQVLTGDRNDLRLDAYNLSQYSSLKSDTLLEFIRRTTDDQERRESLNELRELLKEDVPAVFLYSPLYTFAYHEDVRGVQIGTPSLHSDRFLTLHHWYLQEHRIFKPTKSWWSFFGWVFGL